MNYVDPDGNIFKKIIRGKTITIQAVYYTTKDAMRSAQNAAKFWNKRTDTYLASNNKVYSISYDMTVICVDQLCKFENNNTYELVDSFKSHETAGSCLQKHKINVLRSYSLFHPITKVESTTGAHEIGHTLGMSDTEYGIMSHSQNEFRSESIAHENLQQMLNSDVGEYDLLSKLINLIFNYDW